MRRITITMGDDGSVSYDVQGVISKAEFVGTLEIVKLALLNPAVDRQENQAPLMIANGRLPTDFRR